MTTFQSWGAGDGLEGSGTLSPAYPASIEAGDLLVLCYGSMGNPTFALPTGWTNELTLFGSDDENRVWIRVADGTETGTLDIAITGAAGDVTVAQIGRVSRSNPLGYWSVTHHNFQEPSGANGASDTSWSTSSDLDSTLGLDNRIRSGDLLVGNTVMVNNTAPSWSSETIAATGATIGAVANAQETGQDSTGFDVRIRSLTAAVTAGASSAGATLNHTATLSGSNDGTDIWVRIRELTSPSPHTSGDRTLGGLASFGVSSTPDIASAESGTLLVAAVGYKDSGASLNTPSGWTLEGNFEGGTGVLGPGTGTMGISVFSKISDGTETTVTFDGTTVDILGVALWQISNPDSTAVTLSVAVAFGDNATHDTSWSSTHSLSADVGDTIMSFIAFCQQGGTWASEDIAATGLTKTKEASYGKAGTSTGNDMSLSASQWTVTGAPSTDITLTGTCSSSTSGVAALIRLRADVSLTDADTVGSGDTVGGIDGPIGEDTATFTDVFAEITYGDFDRTLPVQAEALGAVDNGILDIALLMDSDTLSFTEHRFIPFAGDISIVFNEHDDVPGYEISVSDADTTVTSWKLERRDIEGIYPPQPVRGLDGIVPTVGQFEVLDYEAPFQVNLEYYLKIVSGGVTHQLGPFLPDVPAIPVQPGPFGASDYLKHIQTPSLSRRVLVSEMSELSQEGNILGEYHVLGRRNPVVVTDVLSGYKGNMIIAVITSGAQRKYVEIDNLFASGSVLLFQTPNSDLTALEDIYIRITGVSRSRRTVTQHFGRLSPLTAATDVVLLYDVSFTQVDRPITTGVAPSLVSWQDVKDNFTDWQEVKDNRESWLEVLQRADEGP